MKHFKNVKSYEDLKDQYKALLKKNHPDNGGDLETMKEINVEYDALFPIWKTARKPKPVRTSTRPQTAPAASSTPPTAGKAATMISAAA